MQTPWTFDDNVKAFLNPLDSGFILLEETGAILWMNDWVRCRLPNQHQHHTYLQDWYPPNAGASLVLRLQQVLQSGQPERFSVDEQPWLVPLLDSKFSDHRMRQNGMLYPCSIRPFASANPVFCVLLQIHDVSEPLFQMQRLHQKLATYEEDPDNPNVQESLRYRTQQLEALGALTGGVAHDFNNILQGIMMSVEVAKEDIPQDIFVQRSLNQALKFAKRGADLVRQILASIHQKELSHHEIHITPVVEEALQMMRAVLPADIEIHKFLDPYCDTIQGSGCHVHQLVVHLCTHAARRMSSHGGWLQVRLEQLKGHVMLTIQDSGGEASPEFHNVEFDQLFSSTPSTVVPPDTKHFPSALSGIKRIVTDHKAHLEIEQNENSGTSIHVIFPSSSNSMVSEEMLLRVDLFYNKQVLIVEDEKVTLELQKTMLEQLDCKVTTASNGAEGLEVFHHNPASYDLVITDQVMPKMSGDQLAQAMLDERPELPIILITGYSQKMDPIKARKLGIHEFIIKPVGRDQFLRSVQRVFASQGTNAQKVS